MKIIVNKTDIRKGVRNCNDSCPIALALMRTLGTKKVQVNQADVRFGKTLIYLSDEVIDFINAFDEGEKVKPFEFEL